MKKITLASALLLLTLWGSHAQCIRTAMYPSSPVVSNNLGFPQTVSGPYTSEYSQINNMVTGLGYTFTCKNTTSGIEKYITVTDLTNTVIAHGPSPLTVEAITSDQIRLHYSEDAACASASGGNTVTILALLDCLPPSNLSVSDITTTTAVFEWEPLGEESAWQVLVLPNGTAAPTAETAGTDVTVDPAYNYSELTSANKYQFYVRANCGSEFSPWAGPLNFASGCDPITSFSENFDALVIPPSGQQVLPICWSQVKNGPGSSPSSMVSVMNYSANSPSNVLYLYNVDTDTQANLIAASPALGNLSAGTHRLKFFAKSGTATTREIKFGTVNTTTADAEFTELDEITVNGNYEEYAVDYTVYEGTDTFIAIRYNGPQYTSVLIDDIRWEVAPLCADVSQITIPAETITDATATVNWTPNGGETEWDVVYGPTSVTDPSTLTPITPAPTSNPEANLTGLTDNTSYKVWVRSVCGENNGVWVGPKTFKTSCLPTTAINETFDAYTYGTMPDCWAAVKNGTGISVSAAVQVTDSNSQSPTKSLQLYNSSSSASANIIAATQELSNIAAGTHRIRFYAKSDIPAGNLQIGTIDNVSTEGIFTEIGAVDVTSTHTEYTVDFTATDITDTRLAFRHNTPGTYNTIYIDNVVWEPIPSCSDISGTMVTALTPDTASISWTPGSDETEWDVVYGLSAVTDPGTLTPISPAPTTTDATLSGLTANTTYKVWVRSVCGDQNGAWIGPITFNTPCLPVDSFSENFDTLVTGVLPACWSAIKNGTGVSQYAYVFTTDYNFNTPSRSIIINNSNSTAESNLVLVSPNLSNVAAGTHRVKFFAKSSGTAGNLQVGTVDNTTGNAVFTEVEAVAITSTHTEYAVNFTAYDGTDTHIAFRHNTPGTYTSIWIDDIRWEVAPLCADVTNIAFADITTETVNVSWEPQGDETNWQVVYGPSTVTDPTTLTPSDLLTTPDFAMTGLTENTVYKVWVRSACGAPNGDGMWMGPKQVTTKCNAATVPFTEDFETAVVPAMPSCTTVQNLSTANSFITSSPNNYGFTSKVLQYTYNCSVTAPANAWYYTKGLMLTAGTQYSISYKYGGNTSPTGSYVEKLKVMYGTDTTVEGMMEELDNHTFTNNVPTPNEVSFVPEVTGVYYFGFNVYSNACQNNVYIDDIVIQEVLDTNDFNTADFKLYPNPVKDVLHLSYTQNIADVEVYNLLGQKVVEAVVNASTAAIDMAALPSGNYIVKVTSDHQTKTIKVIKE